MTADLVPAIAAGIIGLLFGSFLNVVVYRLPRRQKMAAGRSQCPNCRRVIAWWDNVPLISFAVLRGKCRKCGKSISWRYPAVELISALSAFAVVWNFSASLKALWIYSFLMIMLLITLIDWEHRIIPDVLSLGGTALGWVGALVCLDLTLAESLIGSLAGGGLLLGIALAYRAVRKVDGMGDGDIKLMALIGAFVGWQMIFPVLFVASFFGAMYGIILMRGDSTGKAAVAFGSFLAPAATFVLVFETQLRTLYEGPLL
ncbi:MAG: prepilin peptidase [bacterium]|nr:prepilin peptidase [bacterium]